MISGAKKSNDELPRTLIKLSDTDIINRYLGINQFPCVISSPLREDDYRSSFSMNLKDGAVLWKDFGTGESGNAVQLMAKLWNTSYNDALMKIRMDVQDIIPKASLIRRYKGKVHITSGSEIKIKTRFWEKWDEEYWNSYGISKDFARWCNVFPISHAIFTKEKDGIKHKVTIPMDKYAYAYFEWKDGKESLKLYQPFSKTMKWLSKHDASVWDLWKQAFTWAKKRSNKELIITSSRKDAMCLWENLGVPAMSLQGEGYIPKSQVMQEVLDTFRTVYIWYDNDYTHKDGNPGQDNANKLISMFPSLKNIVIPAELESKDPSDLFKNHGKNALKQIWNEQRNTK